MDTLRAGKRKNAIARLAGGAGLGVVIAAALGAGQAQASESGASFYLLGTGGPGAAIMPPIEGVFLANTLYHYDGKGGGERQFLVGGNLVVGLKANINADFATLLLVPSTDIAGGTLGVGLILPMAVPAVDVSAVISGPRGRTVVISRSEDKFIVGDPVVMTMLGWKRGDLHVQASALVNVPAGNYREGHLSNLAFHRWALDTSLAATWRNEARGWDVTGKAGVTFNGQNHFTDYTTGTEFHVEGSVEKIFSPAFSLGAQAYYFNQLSADTGSGARLGAYKGQVTGVGATAAYNFKIANKIPATLRLHAFTEFDAKNRLDGNSVFLDFTMPLWVKLPPGAAHP